MLITIFRVLSRHIFIGLKKYCEIESYDFRYLQEKTISFDEEEQAGDTIITDFVVGGPDEDSRHLIDTRGSVQNSTSPTRSSIVTGDRPTSATIFTGDRPTSGTIVTSDIPKSPVQYSNGLSSSRKDQPEDSILY